MPKKKILCLADSFRPGGSCVAGIEILDTGEFGSWIRPVSQRPSKAINDLEKTCTDGSRISLLDVVEIDFSHHTPVQHQTENWQINGTVRWEKIEQVEIASLTPAIRSSNRPLWTPARSSYSGHNDLIAATDISDFSSSLALIKPARARVDVSRNDFNNKVEVWISFSWANVQHKIKLTDPVQFAKFSPSVDNLQSSYVIDEPILAISLAEVFEQNGTASKLVAGMIY